MRDEIRVDHEKIDAVIRQLGDLYEQHTTLYRQIIAQWQALQGGDWMGKASRTFYQEMDELVSPSLQRTHEAFEHMADYLDMLKACFDDAEEECRQMIAGDSGAGGGGGESGAGGAGGAGGGGGGGNTPPLVPSQGQYTVQPGDTLWGIAQRHGTTVDELVAANNIADRNLIHPGQVLIIPGSEGAGGGTPPPPPNTQPPSGVNTAPQTQNPFGFARPGDMGPNGKKRWGAQHDLDLNDGDMPWNTADNRSQANYMRALDYLNVDDNGNGRYAPNQYGTHCDTFVVDATRILNRPIPNVIRLDNGNPKYLGVSDMNQWLNNQMPGVSQDRQGGAVGWRVVSAPEALQYSQSGRPAIAISSGHIAMINPSGGRTVGGTFYPNVVQAGATNTYKGNVYDQFRSELGSVRYFVAE